jgi:hypothetical protein
MDGQQCDRAPAAHRARGPAVGLVAHVGCGATTESGHSVTAIQKGTLLPALQRLLGHDRLTTTESTSTSHPRRWCGNSE